MKKFSNVVRKVISIVCVLSMLITSLPIATTANAAGGDLQLSVADGDVITGKALIMGSSANPGAKLSLAIDGTTVADKQILAEPAQLVFEADNFEKEYRNAILIGDTVVHEFDVKEDVNNFDLITVSIPAEYLYGGELNTISIWSGSTKMTGDPAGGNDGFKIKNARLVLADGTEIYDKQYQTDWGHWLGGTQDPISY